VQVLFSFNLNSLPFSKIPITKLMYIYTLYTV
jgi:hypothetical protein